MSSEVLMNVLLFLPGFISIKVYDLLVPSIRRDFSKSLLEVVSYSVLNLAVSYPLLAKILTADFRTDNPALYIILFLVIVLILPVLWPIVFLRISTWRPIAKYVLHPTQQPWDYVFGQREVAWVLVSLKNGNRIGGKFDTESFASSAPAQAELYLQEVWTLDEDDKFVEPAARSNGALILGNEISIVEFFR